MYETSLIDILTGVGVAFLIMVIAINLNKFKLK